MSRFASRNKKGLNLIETLLVSVIAIVMLIVIYRMLTRGMELADGSTKAIALQQGARNLMENIVRDVNTAHIFGDAQKDTFTVLKYLNDKPKETADINVANGLLTYPFYADGVVTQHVLPAIKCSYKFFPDKGTIVRKVKEGELVSMTPATGMVGENMLKFQKYVWRNEKSIKGEPADGRVLAKNVKKFELTYFGYDDDKDGGLKEASQITARDAEAKIARVAMVLVYFRALFDEGLYKSDLKAPDIEMMTKVWSYKKINDHVYREYFSSMDDDTRF